MLLVTSNRKPNSIWFHDKGDVLVHVIGKSMGGVLLQACWLSYRLTSQCCFQVKPLWSEDGSQYHLRLHAASFKSNKKVRAYPFNKLGTRVPSSGWITPFLSLPYEPVGPGSDCRSLWLWQGAWDYSYKFKWVWSQSCPNPLDAKQWRRGRRDAGRYPQFRLHPAKSAQPGKGWWWCWTVEQIHALCSFPVSGTVHRAHSMAQVLRPIGLSSSFLYTNLYDPAASLSFTSSSVKW